MFFRVFRGFLQKKVVWDSKNGRTDPPRGGGVGTVFKRGPSARENFFFGLKKIMPPKKKNVRSWKTPWNGEKKREKKLSWSTGK